VLGDLQKLFTEVADLDTPSRSRYFDEHGTPADMRQEIESLLHFDRAAPGDF
jgi:hypothetical protein